MTKSEKAKEYFLSGYNCSQAVAMAFADEIGIDKKQIAMLTSGFGGGMGRMREVCGAVSAMTFVLSALYGYDSAENTPQKQELYKTVQELAGRFKEENGSIVCRELLGLSISGADSPTPEERTKQYYKKRPCAELVECSAMILENYIKNKNSK